MSGGVRGSTGRKIERGGAGERDRGVESERERKRDTEVNMAEGSVEPRLRALVPLHNVVTQALQGRI